jgi:hypothetical protein
MEIITVLLALMHRENHVRRVALQKVGMSKISAENTVGVCRDRFGTASAQRTYRRTSHWIRPRKNPQSLDAGFPVAYTLPFGMDFVQA